METLKYLLIITTALVSSGFTMPLYATPLEVSRLRQSPPLAPDDTSFPPAHIIQLPEQQTTNTLTFYPGSLKENIQRIAKECGWGTVVWKTPYDYHWVGTTHFLDSYLPDILHKVLSDYPLQAVFYQGNHILVITPRNLS